ncbi:MAG: hypothetical protein N2448_00190 [Caloramator sp.]|nr:hypothetical protein [Caloramator sp.]
MQSLKEKIKQRYPLMKIVDDEANCDMSVKFNRYGFIDFDDWVAIRSGNTIEIYDQEGILREILSWTSNN